MDFLLFFKAQLLFSFVQVPLKAYQVQLPSSSLEGPHRFHAKQHSSKPQGKSSALCDVFVNSLRRQFAPNARREQKTKTDASNDVSEKKAFLRSYAGQKLSWRESSTFFIQKRKSSFERRAREEEPKKEKL